MTGTATAAEGLLRQRREPNDTVLVDLMLAGNDGFENIRQLRRDDFVPIVVVSARDDTHGILGTLKASSDDYLVEPGAVKELSARLRALRRWARAAVTTECPSWCSRTGRRPAAGEVTVGGRPVPITRTPAGRSPPEA